MIVGILNVKLLMRRSHSLKEKRIVIKGLKDRVRSKFNVSVAETGMQENCQNAVIGVAIIGVARRYVDVTLSSVINYFSLFPHVELIDYDIDLV